MRLAIICGGIPKLSTEEPLQYIGDSVDNVISVLNNNQWKCIPFKEATSTTDYKNLLSVYKGQKIEEFLFYYIGHGTGSMMREFRIHFQENPLSVNDIKEATINALERYPKKMALVLDACYSGNAIDASSSEKDVEILTARGRDEEAYEYIIEGKGWSEFSFYFCNIFKTSQESDTLNLEQIGKYIADDEQTGKDTFYLPNPSCQTDKIIIGYNKEINELTNFLKENHTLKALKEKLLTYYPRRASNHNKIRHADNFNELMNILLNERKYLKCILKELEFDSSIVNEYATVDCKDLKQKASQENKIDKLIIKVEESTDKGLDSATISGYYGYTLGGYSPIKTVSDLDLSGEKSLIEIPKYIDEVLIGKKARTIELQLILSDVLLSLNYQTEEMNSRFVLLKRLVRRLNNHHLLDIEDEIDYWEENSQLIQELKNDSVVNHIDNGGCVSLFNKHSEKKIAMLYNESLSSQIKEVYDWGVPILFYPHSSYEMLDKLELNGCVVANFKNKMSAFMTNEFLEDNATHFIYDDYYDVDFLPKTDI